MRCLIIIGVLFWSLGTARASDPDALWKIVHGACVPGQMARRDPKPCLAIDLDKGFAVLKDIVGIAQLLLIPTAKIPGIESPAVLAPGAPNYWQAAWEARRLMPLVQNRRVPEDDIGLAINSELGRSQNQLHIHIDCVRADVKAALIKHRAGITAAWSAIPEPLAGSYYRAMRLEAPDFSGHDLFKLLAATDPAAGKDMADQTLAALRMDFGDRKKAFVILNDHASVTGMDNASSEQLLDHDCTAVR